MDWCSYLILWSPCPWNIMLLEVLVWLDRYHLRYHMEFFLVYYNRNLLTRNHLYIACVIHAVDTAVVWIDGIITAATWRPLVGPFSSKDRCNLRLLIISFARAALSARLERYLAKFGYTFLFLLLRALLQRGSQIEEYWVRIGKVVELFQVY